MNLTYIAIAIFATIFLAVTAVFLVAYDRLSQRNRRLRERMRTVAEGPSESTESDYLLLRDQSYSHIPFLDRLLAQMAVARRLQKYIEEAGLPIRAGALILAALSLTSIAMLVLNFFLKDYLISFLLALPLLAVPFLYVSWKRKKRIDRFEELLPEAIDLIVNALRSGFSLEASLSLVAQELPDPLGTEFAITYEEQNLGVDLVTALRNFTLRIPSEDLLIMATAISIQRRTGGNLTEVLGRIAAMIRERFNLRREISIRTAQGRLSGGILVILPLAMGVLIQFLNPSYLSSLFHDPVGPFLITGALILQVLGILVIRRIIKLHY
jgi:tight adherence protein B